MLPKNLQAYSLKTLGFTPTEEELNAAFEAAFTVLGDREVTRRVAKIATEGETRQILTAIALIYHGISSRRTKFTRPQLREFRYGLYHFQFQPPSTLDRDERLWRTFSLIHYYAWITEGR